MTSNKHRILRAALAACVLATFISDCNAKLTGRQQSLTGVKLVTVHVNCSDLAKETGLNEEEIRKSITKQLEDAGIKVVRHQIWETLPGRCRLRASISIYKPLHLETLMYNLRVEFIQAVTLARLPEAKIDATTWQRAWFANGSEKRLAEAVPHNLNVLTALFVRDYRQANPKDNRTSDPNNPSKVSRRQGESNSPSETGEYQLIASKSSDVFHKSDCRWAANISPDNLVSYQTREEAVKAGKRPCKQCNP